MYKMVHDNLSNCVFTLNILLLILLISVVELLNSTLAPGPRLDPCMCSPTRANGHSISTQTLDSMDEILKTTPSDT